MLAPMSQEKERIEERRRRDIVIARRDTLLQRARATMNRARLNDVDTWNPRNMAYAMRPETARFLLDCRPELFKRPRNSPDEAFWLDGIRVFLSEALDPDEIIVCHGWWPLVDEVPT